MGQIGPYCLGAGLHYSLAAKAREVEFGLQPSLRKLGKVCPGPFILSLQALHFLQRFPQVLPALASGSPLCPAWRPRCSSACSACICAPCCLASSRCARILARILVPSWVTRSSTISFFRCSMASTSTNNWCSSSPLFHPEIAQGMIDHLQPVKPPQTWFVVTLPFDLARRGDAPRVGVQPQADQQMLVPI